MIKKIIKKLAKIFLSERDIKELLSDFIFIYPDKINDADIRNLMSDIFNKNPKFREYILFRKSILLNNSFIENKDYILGAIDELNLLENLASKNYNDKINEIPDTQNINDFITKIKSLTRS